MIKTKYYDGLNVVVHIGAGEVTLQDVLDAATAWWSHADYGPEIPAVWDFVDANWQLSQDEVRNLNDEQVRRINMFRPRGRTAWVVPDTLTGKLIESFYASQPWSTEWQVFDDPGPAIEWARGDEISPA